MARLPYIGSSSRRDRWHTAAVDSRDVWSTTEPLVVSDGAAITGKYAARILGYVHAPGEAEAA